MAETGKEVATLTGAGGFIFTPKTLDEARSYAKTVAESGLCPTAYKSKPDDVLVAWQYGAELGLKPLQALQGIAVINGRPSIWGDAMLAVVQASGLVESFEETDDGKTATCNVKRKGNPAPIIRTFSIEDAKAAGLGGKAGPWTNYPKRMRQMRARAFALRDGFSDVLKGIACAEEAQDYETIQRIDDKIEIVAPRRASESPATAQASAPIGIEDAPANVAPTAAAEQVADFVPSKVTKAGDDFRIYDKDELYTTKDAGLAAIAKAAKEHGKNIRVTFVMEAMEGKIKTLALLEGAAA